MTQFRQGDVWITETTTLPPTLLPVVRDHGRVVLAYGEVTGHAHAITHPAATLLVDPASNRRFLVIDDGSAIEDPEVTLDHEEHGTITLPPGSYEVRVQRQYTPQGVQRVAD